LDKLAQVSPSFWQVFSGDIDVNTPYDGKIGIFCIDGRFAPANIQTINELLDDLKAKAPNISAVYVKTNNGSVWQSRPANGWYDQRRTLGTGLCR
jgi:hypothetical protein